MKKSAFPAVCGILLAITFANAGYASAESPAGLDFSRAGYDCSTVSATEFLTEKLGISISADEEEYLEAFPDFTIKYNANIAGRYINAVADGADLKVSATKYEYTAANGSKVIWSPESAEGLASGSGTWSFPISGMTEDYVTVKYGTTLYIDKSYINSLLNQYYNAARSAAEKIRIENEKYNAYQNYVNESKRYEEYLEQYAKWNRDNELYQAYLREYNQYLEELEEYNSYNYEAKQQEYNEAWQRYLEYQVAYENYLKLYDEYLACINTPEMDKVKAQIGIIDYIYAVAGDNRTIYNAVMGDTVTEVLARKDDLKLAGADGDAVDIASVATKNLRNLFSNYNSIKDEAAKYAFYVTTYSSLSDNLNELLRVLDYFYRISAVRTFIEKSGKNEKFCILVAQLYEITDALSVDPVTNYEAAHRWKDPASSAFGPSYKINGRTPAQILGSALLDYTDSPEPLKNGYPLLPPEPVEPERVEEPDLTLYERPAKPVPPEEVGSPGAAPEKVPQPVKPAGIPELNEPYAPTEWESKLAAADGKIEYRQPYGSGYSLKLTTDVKKYFRNYNGVTVYFYPDKDSSEYLYFEESINGSYIEYPPDAPQPQKTLRGYTFTFSGWEYYDGTPVDFNNLPKGEEAVNVYPSFIQTPNLYDVIWVIDGVEYPRKAAYDSIPQFDGEPQKAPDKDGRQYRFVHWDRDLQVMTDSSVRYVAQFESSFLITWSVQGKADLVTSVWKGDMPEYDGTPYREPDNILSAYVFTGWDKPLAPASRDEKYTAQFTGEYLVPLGNNFARITQLTLNENVYYQADCGEADSSKLNIGLLLQTAAVHISGVRIVRGSSYTATFSYAEVYNLAELGVEYIEASIEWGGAGSYRYSCYVTFYNADGAEVGYDGTLSFMFSGQFDYKNSHMFHIVEGQEPVETRFSFDDNNVSIFNMRGTGRYDIYPMFNVYVYVNIDQADGLITVDKELARKKDTIQIILGDLPKGKYLERVYAYYVTDTGVKPLNIEDMSFTMPASDVTVGVVLGNLQYVVTFCSESKTISRMTYFYGDEITPPANPIKAPDGVNSYVFVGWDTELMPVTGNVTYNAVFDAVPLPHYEGEGQGLSKITVTVICVASAVLFVFVAAIVTIIVILVRRKKRKKAQK